MSERVIGYILLTVGILIMGFSVYYAYNVLTNRVKPLTVFHTTPAKQDIEQNPTNPSALVQMQTQILSQVLEKQMTPSLNLGATLFLMYFVMLFGYRLSSLGVQLVRPIKVNLKAVADTDKKTTT